MSGVRITLTGKEAALDALADAAAAMDHPRPLFDEIGAALAVSTQMRFERGVGPDGNPWPPSLRAIVEGGRTLVDSARLMGSITHEATDSGVAVGTNLIYAAIHQFGGVIRPVSAPKLAFKLATGQKAFVDQVTIPARPFLGLDDDDETEIAAIAADWIRRVTGAEGEAAP